MCGDGARDRDAPRQPNHARDVEYRKIAARVHDRPADIGQLVPPVWVAVLRIVAHAAPELEGKRAEADDNH
eukprot:864256-Prymnesium_polylepis.1